MRLTDSTSLIFKCKQDFYLTYERKVLKLFLFRVIDFSCTRATSNGELIAINFIGSFKNSIVRLNIQHPFDRWRLLVPRRSLNNLNFYIYSRDISIRYDLAH